MKRSYPPGPKPAEILRSANQWHTDPLGHLTRLHNAHGDIVTLGRWGRTIFVALFHPDAVRRVLVTNAQAYGRGPANKKFAVIEGQGLFVAEGPQWLASRRRLQPAFQSARLEDHSDHILQSAQALCERWQPYAQECCAFDVMPELLQHQITAAGPAVFGCDMSTHASLVADAVQVARDHVSHLISHPLAPPPFVPTTRNRRFNHAKYQLEAVNEELRVQRHEKSNEQRSDALSLLLQVTDVDDKPLSVQQVRDEIMTLLVTGHHPTAAAMTWALYLLASHPTQQTRMRQEIDRCRQGRELQTSDLAVLPFTTAVIQEALRLYPPVWAQSRSAIQDDVIAGYDIPRGSQILIPQLIVHRHPAFWPHPHEFYPERFLGKSTPTSNLASAYFPFGAGQRACLGSRLALLVMKLTLAVIVQRFELSYVGEEPPQLAPGVTLMPQNGIHLTLRERSS